MTIPVRLSDLDYFQADSPTAHHGPLGRGERTDQHHGDRRLPKFGRNHGLPTHANGERHTDTPSDLLNENNRPLCPDLRSPDRVRSFRGIDRARRRGRGPDRDAAGRGSACRRGAAPAPPSTVVVVPVPVQPNPAVASPAPAREATAIAGSIPPPPSRPSRRPRSPRSASSGCPGRLIRSRRRAASSTARCGSPSTACSGRTCPPRPAAIGS